MAKEKITISEVKEIVNRAIDDCTVWINTDEIGGGHSLCAFCGCECHNCNKKTHYDDCLVKELERIVDSKIEE